MTDPITHIASDGAAPNLAVDVLPDSAAGTFVWDVSEWDSFDLLGWEETPTGWVNAVCDVTRVSIRRGATRHQGVLTRTEAGTCSLSIRDTGRRFDPTNNADAIHANTPIRVRAWGVLNPVDEVIDGGGPDSFTGGLVDGGSPASTGTVVLDGGSSTDSVTWSEVLFTGTIEDIGVVYAKSGPPTVTITATDLVSDLAAWEAEGYPDPGVGAGDSLLSRTVRVLDEMSMPAAQFLADDIDSLYAATLAATNLAEGWPELTAAVDAELGRLWVDRHNQLIVRARNSELSGELRGTLSDVHDEIAGGTVHCCYDDAEVVYGTELLTNRAIAGRRVPATDPASPPSAVVQVDDEYSRARYGLRAVDRRNLELQTDEQLQPWCTALLLGATEPELRVESVSLAPFNAPEAWPQVAATDIGDRWAFRLRPELGPTVARTLGVLGIAHDITPERWSCEWLTAEAPTPGDGNPTGWFAWDVSDWDSDDLLAPFGGAVPV